MRDFSDIKELMGLKKFLYSHLGTLYFTPSSLGEPRIMVRHFDSNLSTTLVVPFAHLVKEVQQWVKKRPSVSQFVDVEIPVEIGLDYIARPYHTYHTSTSSYVKGKNPPDPPEELDQMRRNLYLEIGKPNSPKDQIIENILSKSLLEPTGKTYFSGSLSEGKFVVVEPKLTSEDVEHWAALEMAYQ